jgi:uncharacterized protein YkwD
MEADAAKTRFTRDMSRMLFAVLTFITTGAGATEITRESVVAEMNVRRTATGLPLLRENGRLTAAAEDRMRDMEEQAYWAHNSPDGRSPFEWLRPRGYEFSYAGENLAAGFETAEVLVDGWMESKGHRDNILSPLYSECGVAVIDGATTGKQTGRSIVVMFARPRPQQPAESSRSARGN